MTKNYNTEEAHKAVRREIGRGCFRKDKEAGNLGPKHGSFHNMGAKGYSHIEIQKSHSDTSGLYVNTCSTEISVSFLTVGLLHA